MSKTRVTDFFKPKVQSVSVENIDQPPKKTPNLTVIPQEQETVHADKPFHPTIIRGCITMKGKYDLLCSVKNQR